MPAGAKELMNPHPVTEASMAEVLKHFVEHRSVWSESRRMHARHAVQAFPGGAVYRT